MSSPIATAWVEIVPEMSKFSSQLRQDVGSATGSIERESRGLFGNIAGVAGKTIAGVGLAVAGVAATVAGIALTGGLNRALAIEQAEAKLTGLGHSVESVEAIMQNALDAVRGTAFGLGDAAGVAATIVASGIEPGEELTRVLSLVGDAATIAGTDMGSMGAIFAKVAASNKLQMDTINQLHDAGIPALQLVAQELGVTAEEAARMASAGEISFETFSAAMESGLGGAALSAGETFSGAMANLKAALGRQGASFWTPLLENFTPVIGNLTGLIDDFGISFEGAFDGWAVIVERVAGGVDGIITRIRDAMGSGESLGSVLEGALAGTPGGAIALGVFEALADAFEDIRAALIDAGVPDALADVGRELGGAIADALIEIGPSLPGIVTAFSDLVIALLPLVPSVVDLAVELLPLVEALVDLAAEDLLPVVVDGLGDAVPLLEDLVGILTDSVGVVGPMIDFWESLAGFTDGVDADELRDFSDVMDDLVESADGMFASVGLDGYQEYVDGFVSRTMTVADFIRGELMPPFFELRDAVQDSFLKIQDAVNVFLDNFMIGEQSLGDILDRIKNGFLGLPQFAADAWSMVQQAFFNARVQVGIAVGQVVTGLAGVWNTIKSILPAPVVAGIDQVLGFFRNLPASIGGIVAGSQGSFLSIGQSIVSGIAQGIRNGASGIANAIVNAVTGGAQAGRAAAEVNSPSKLYARLLGEPIAEGIGYGIDQGQHFVDEALARTVTSATSVGAFDSNVTYGNLRSDGGVVVQQDITMVRDDPEYVMRVSSREFERATAGEAP